MDIFQQQSMQNWKKQIIMDPHLNSLFDTSVSASNFIDKILTLPHEHIVKIYMKLSSLKHAISKNMQKQIEAKYDKIQQSFQQNYEIKNNYEAINQQNIKNSFKNIQKFNEKYELISEKVVEFRNLSKILNFSNALQSLKVNVRLLRSLMKDFEQNISNKHLDQLVNSQRISKILREISNLTVRHDFSGIKSFEEQRAFINNSRGAIYGLIQKQLTQILLKLPYQNSSKKQQLQKDTINKLNVLININKLKDFRTTFYRNNLKQMSQIIKKCLNIGLAEDERDPKNYLLIFEEYFINSVHKKIIDIGTVFVVFQEIIEKNNIKTSLNTNFFEKYWQNLIDFFKGLLAWSIQNDPKQWLKQKLNESIHEAFTMLETKNQINRYLTSIFWKYPIIYNQLASVSDSMHLLLIKFTKYHYYDFSSLKEKMIRELCPLAEVYYRHSYSFYESWSNKIQELVKKDGGEIAEDNHLFIVIRQHFVGKDKGSTSSLKIMQWLLSCIKNQEIYDYHIEKGLAVLDHYFSLFQKAVQSKLEKEQLQFIIQKSNNLLQDFKNTFRRSKLPISKAENLPKLHKQKTDSFLCSKEMLLTTITKFKDYSSLIKQWQQTD